MTDKITLTARYPDGREIKILGISAKHLAYIHNLMQEVADKTDGVPINDYWYYPNPISERYRNRLPVSERGLAGLDE